MLDGFARPYIIHRIYDAALRTRSPLARCRALDSLLSLIRFRRNFGQRPRLLRASPTRAGPFIVTSAAISNDPRYNPGMVELADAVPTSSRDA